MTKSPEKDRPEEEPADRRAFFRESLASILSPLAGIVQKRLDRIGKAMNVPEEPLLLRPPGALPEEKFLETCEGCAKCVAVCPVQAIYLVPGPGGRGDAKPVIHAESQPCVVCDDLSCMQECPTGALAPTPRDDIRMGLAEFHSDQCLRTGGENCTLCVDMCPLGERAIHLGKGEGDSMAPVVVEDPGCIGCGVCEHYCPTDPRAITVELVLPPAPQQLSSPEP